MKYDVIVIGSGTGGQTAAFALRQKGLNVALVENSDTPGGICALAGCQAKKWFYETAEVIAKSRHLEKRGIVTPAGGDWNSVWKQKSGFTDKVPENTVKGIKGLGITYIEGTASFVSEHSISVGNETYEADYFIIATGSQTVSLPIQGAEHLIDSWAFLARESLPQKIIFIGGGFISMEFSHFAARIGPEKREITILEVADRVLGNFDRDMVELVVQASEKDGINIQTNVEINVIEKKGSGYQVVLSSGKVLEADLVVNGAGRVPELEPLQLKNAGIASTRRGIETNSLMQTSTSNIYAVGDCVDSFALARVADFEAHTAVRNIMAEKSGNPQLEIDYSFVPSVLFTYPQCAMVGETEESVAEKGIWYDIVMEKNVQWPTYKRVGIDTAGYKLILSEDDRILGAHIVSDNPGGLVNTFAHAMRNGSTIDDIYWDNIMTPYPTRESDITYMLSQLIM